MYKKENRDTTIRVKQDTKNVLENLDFVKKHSFDTIIKELVKYYGKSKKKSLKCRKCGVKIK